MSSMEINKLIVAQMSSGEAVGVDDVKEALSSVSGEVVQKEVETKAEDELVVVDELEDDVENNPEVKEENEEDKSDEVIEITAEDFKDFFSKNEKMDELIAGYGYETVFEYFDEDKDGKISKEEIKKVSSSADSLEDITFGEMKTFLEKKGKGASEEEKGVTKEELNEIVNSLKEQMMAQMQAQQQAQMGGSSGGGGYSGGSSGGGGNVGSINNATANADGSTPKTVEEYEEKINSKEEEKTTLTEAADKYIKAQEDVITEAFKEAGIEEEIIAEYEEQVEQLDNDIQGKEEEIETEKSVIQDCNATIEAKTNAISEYDSQISSLQSSLDGLDSEEDADKIASIQSSIANLEAAKEQAEAEKEKAEADLEEAEENLANLEEEKLALEEEKKTLRDEIIEEHKDKITDEIKEKIENAEKEIDKIKETEASEVEKIDEEIETLKIELAKLKEEEKTKEILDANAVKGKLPSTDEELAAYGFDTEKKREGWRNLTPEMQEAIVELTDYASSIGLKIGYGSEYSIFRTREMQQHLYDTLPKGQAAAPGKSKHETGEAVDIRIEGGSDADYTKLGEYWESMGYTWGGRFTAVRENWHFDIRTS